MRSIWFAAAASDAPRPLELHVLPDGCMEIVFPRNGALRSGTGAGEQASFDRPFVVGQCTRPHALLIPPGLSLVGVRLRPGGAFPFFSLDLRELADRLVHLEDLWGPARMEDASARLDGIVHGRDRIRGVTSMISAALAGASRSDRTAAWAATMIEEARGRVTVSGLAQELGIGTRRLRAVFDRSIGISPKTLAGVLRFRSAYESMRAGDRPRQCDAALEAGYADQSHMVRDFHRFAGASPQGTIDRWRHSVRLARRGADSFKTPARAQA